MRSKLRDFLRLRKYSGCWPSPVSKRRRLEAIFKPSNSQKCQKLQQTPFVVKDESGPGMSDIRFLLLRYDFGDKYYQLIFANYWYFDDFTNKIGNISAISIMLISISPIFTLWWYFAHASGLLIKVQSLQSRSRQTANGWKVNKYKNVATDIAVRLSM